MKYIGHHTHPDQFVGRNGGRMLLVLQLQHHPIQRLDVDQQLLGLALRGDLQRGAQRTTGARRVRADDVHVDDLARSRHTAALLANETKQT